VAADTCAQQAKTLTPSTRTVTHHTTLHIHPHPEIEGVGVDIRVGLLLTHTHTNNTQRY